MLLAVDTEKIFEYEDIEDGLRAVKEAGFDAIDLSFYDSAAKLLCGDDYREKAYAIKDLLQKYGLRCNQAHAPFDFLYGMPEDDSCFAYLSIKRSIESCGIIGIDHIVVHGIRVPESPVSVRSIEYNYRYYKNFEPLCKQFGVKIAVENLSAAFTYPDLLNAIMRKLDSPWFVALVDVGHAWHRAEMQPGDFIRRLDPDILKGLHIQDNHGKRYDVDEHILPFLGTVDYHDLMKALKETGYDGDFTLEIVNYLEAYAKEGLLAPALLLAHAVGRKLIAEME